MTGRRESKRLARQCLGVVACMSLLAVAGRGQLGTPPLLHPGNLMRWWSSQDPVTGAVSLLRVGGLIAGGYWLLVCGLAMVAHVTGRGAWLMRLRLPGLGRLLRKAAGASMIGAAVAGAAGCGVVGSGHPGAGRVPRPPVLVPVEPAPVTLVPVEPAPVSTTGPPIVPATGPPAVPPATPTLTTWVVRPGDDLWSISASVLEARLGHPPDDRTVAALWLRVIDLNRPNLPDPSNPGLIFAGEVVAIPG